MLHKYYKMTNDDRRCGGFQYELYKTYIHTGEMITKDRTTTGFHCVENPLIYLLISERYTRLFEVMVGPVIVPSQDLLISDTMTMIREIEGVEKDELLTGTITCSKGITYRFKNGKLHSENDLPAVEEPDGTKSWYVQNIRHRGDDKPEIEFDDGAKF